MTQSYTPTPWATQGRVKITRHVDGYQINPKMFVAIALDVTTPGNPPFAYAETPEKAAFIVRAANNFDELVAALKATLTAWAAAKAGDVAGADWMNAAEAQAKAAIKKAEADA